MERGLCPHCGCNYITPHDREKCKEIQDNFTALGVGKAPKALPRAERFDVAVVSAAADNKIADLEQAMQLMLTAQNDSEKDDAYTYLNATREALYKHIGNLESQLNVKRTVIKRF